MVPGSSCLLLSKGSAMPDDSASCSNAAIVLLQIRRTLVCLMQSADGILAIAYEVGPSSAAKSV